MDNNSNYGEKLIDYLKRFGALYRFKYKMNFNIEICANCGYPKTAHCSGDCVIAGPSGKIIAFGNTTFKKSELLTKNFWVYVRLMGFNPNFKVIDE